MNDEWAFSGFGRLVSNGDSVFLCIRRSVRYWAFVASLRLSFGSLLGNPPRFLIAFVLLNSPLRGGEEFFVRPHPSFPFSQREGTVLHCKSKLHHYHISFESLLIIFGVADYYQYFRKARAVL
jgi:hypothetical protein